MQNTPETLPDNPADARDLNKGRDVLKTAAHTPEPWHCNGVQIIGKAGKRTQNIAECFNVGFEATTANARRIVECVNACHALEHPADDIYHWSHHVCADPAATIEALRGALEMSYQELFRIAPNSTTFAVVARALALCARDGKGGAL